MSGQFGVGGELDPLVCGFGGDRGGIGNDKRDDKLASVADDHGIEDVGAGLERVFDGLRSNEFSSGGFQQIFFAVGNEEIVVFVHVADVAGAEPAVFAKNFAGGFGVLVIAMHDARTLDEDFSILGNADLNIRNWFAGTAHAIHGVIAGNDRRSFRQTITLIDGNADGPEKFRERFGERRAARRDDAQMAAGSQADFLVDQFISELPLCFQGEACMSSVGAPGSGSLRHAHGPIKNHSLYARGFRALLDQAGIDFFEEARDGSDDGGTDFEKSLSDRIDGFDVGESGALKDVDVIERAAVDVSKRKKGKRDVFGGIEAEIMAHVVDVRAKIAVREHDALGLAGGTGGVDEGGELAGKNLGSAQTVGGNVRGVCCSDESFVAETFRGRNGFPAAIAANHLGTRVRMSVDGIQEARWKRAVVHGLSVTLPYPFGWRNEAMDCHFR